MEDDGTVDLKSSAGMFSEFLESSIWHDLVSELQLWLDGARDGLEDTSADEKELYRNQGRADAVRRMMLLPETMRDTLLEDQRDESHDESNTDEMEEILNG